MRIKKFQSKRTLAENVVFGVLVTEEGERAKQLLDQFDDSGVIELRQIINRKHRELDRYRRSQPRDNAGWQDRRYEIKPYERDLQWLEEYIRVNNLKERIKEFKELHSEESFDEAVEMTADEMKAKQGTDNPDIINAGKEEQDRVVLKEGSDKLPTSVSEIQAALGEPHYAYIGGGSAEASFGRFTLSLFQDTDQFYGSGEWRWHYVIKVDGKEIYKDATSVEYDNATYYAAQVLLHFIEIESIFKSNLEAKVVFSDAESPYKRTYSIISSTGEVLKTVGWHTNKGMFIRNCCKDRIVDETSLSNAGKLEDERVALKEGVSNNEVMEVIRDANDEAKRYGITDEFTLEYYIGSAVSAFGYPLESLYVFLPDHIHPEDKEYKDAVRGWKENMGMDESLTEAMTYTDTNGFLGEPGEKYTMSQFRRMWQDKDNDPSMSGYDTFEEWVGETISQMDAHEEVEEFTTDSKYYVYENDDDVVSDSFDNKEDAVDFAKENGYPIVKIHNYYIDNDKHYPDGEPIKVWDVTEEAGVAPSGRGMASCKIWKDTNGIMGNPGEEYTLDDLADYWTNNNGSDPVLAEYKGDWKAWLDATIPQMEERVEDSLYCESLDEDAETKDYVLTFIPKNDFEGADMTGRLCDVLGKANIQYSDAKKCAGKYQVTVKVAADDLHLAKVVIENCGFFSRWEQKNEETSKEWEHKDKDGKIGRIRQSDGKGDRKPLTRDQAKDIAKFRGHEDDELYPVNEDLQDYIERDPDEFTLSIWDNDELVKDNVWSVSDALEFLHDNRGNIIKASDNKGERIIWKDGKAVGDGFIGKDIDDQGVVIYFKDGEDVPTHKGSEPFDVWDWFYGDAFN